MTAPGSESPPLRSSHAVPVESETIATPTARSSTVRATRSRMTPQRPGVRGREEQSLDRCGDLPDGDVEAHPRGDRDRDRGSERADASRAEQPVGGRERRDRRDRARQPTGGRRPSDPTRPGEDAPPPRRSRASTATPGAPPKVAAVGAIPAARKTTAIATARRPSTIIATTPASTPAAESSGAETPISGPGSVGSARMARIAPPSDERELRLHHEPVVDLPAASEPARTRTVGRRAPGGGPVPGRPAGCRLAARRGRCSPAAGPSSVANAQTPAATTTNATTRYPPDQSPAALRIAADADRLGEAAGTEGGEHCRRGGAGTSAPASEAATATTRQHGEHASPAAIATRLRPAIPAAARTAAAAPSRPPSPSAARSAAPARPIETVAASSRISAVIPKPSGSDPAAPSASAARPVPARPRPTRSHAGVSAADQHQRADPGCDGRVGGGTRDARERDDRSGGDDAERSARDARHRRTSAGRAPPPRARRAPPTAASAIAIACGQRAVDDLAEAEQHDRAARDRAGRRPGGGRRAAPSDRNEGRREQPHDAGRRPRPGDGRAHGTCRDDREVGRPRGAEQLHRGDDAGRATRGAQARSPPARLGRADHAPRWSSAASRRRRSRRRRSASRGCRRAPRRGCR